MRNEAMHPLIRSIRTTDLQVKTTLVVAFAALGGDIHPGDAQRASQAQDGGQFLDLFAIVDVGFGFGSDPFCGQTQWTRGRPAK